MGRNKRVGIVNTTVAMRWTRIFLYFHLFKRDNNPTVQPSLPSNASLTRPAQYLTQINASHVVDMIIVLLYIQIYYEG